MPDVITSSATVVCLHHFPIPVTASRTLTVGGASVFGQTELLAAVPSCTDPQTKCTSVASVSTGLSSALTVDGSFVALSTLIALTNVGPTSLTPPPPPSPLTSS
jgi:hypothetical protein